MAMNLRKLTTATLFLLLGGLASAQEVGSKLPPVQLADLAKTDATSFDDYLGRAVLLEFFAHWCGPCGAQVPHLNEVSETYEGQGLSVIGVTGSRESKEKTVQWVKKHKAQFAYGYDPDSRLAQWLGITSIPHSVLLDPEGTIVWRGHPSGLTDEHLKKAVEGALHEPLWENEAAAETRKAIEERRFAAAVAAAQKMPEDEQGPVIVAHLKRMAADRIAVIQKVRAEGDYLAAQHFAESAAKELAGLPEAVTAAEIVTELAKDEKVQKVISAQLEFRRVMEELSKVESREAAEKLLTRLDTLSAENPGTIVAQRIAMIMKRVRR